MKLYITDLLDWGINDGREEDPLEADQGIPEDTASESALEVFLGVLWNDIQEHSQREHWAMPDVLTHEDSLYTFCSSSDRNYIWEGEGKHSPEHKETK